LRMDTMQAMRSIPLLVIEGPTATGKTGAAIRAARAADGEIVSSDSMQIYRHLAVGTAKPTEAERSSARFHMIDCVEPDEPYTVADFQRDAQAAIVDIWQRGKLPILCGGTGLYIRALLQHFDFPPTEPAPREQIRARLEADLAEEGSAALHRRLAEADPASATRIAVADSKRIIRALEVFELTGKGISAQRRVDAMPEVQYNPVKYMLSRPREALYAGINDRVEQMISAGWLDEVRWIQARGYDPALQSLQAIGYRHLLAWLGTLGEGPTSRPLRDVVEEIKRDTRRFAKRQLTWFRRDAEAIWREWSDEEGLRAVTKEVCLSARRLREHRGCRI